MRFDGSPLRDGALNTTLPLLSSVRTSVYPSPAITPRRSSMAMRLAVPTLIPRRRATCDAAMELPFLPTGDALPAFFRHERAGVARQVLDELDAAEALTRPVLVDGHHAHRLEPGVAECLVPGVPADLARVFPGRALWIREPDH